MFGVIIQGEPSERKPLKQRDAKFNRLQRNDAVQWSILKTLNQYLVLTGDYESCRGIFYYKSFKDGILYQWEVDDKAPYKLGIYRVDSQNPQKGYFIDMPEQDLVFSTQTSKAKDGVYKECQLRFENGGLILNKQEDFRFLATINEYVPVHSYSSEKGENQTIPAKQLNTRNIRIETAVVALGDKGTQVVAIYIIEKSDY